MSEDTLNVVPFKRSGAAAKPSSDEPYWPDTEAMLLEVIKDIRSGDIKPDGVMIIVREKRADGQEHFPYYSRKLSRLEVLGLLATMTAEFALWPPEE